MLNCHTTQQVQTLEGKTIAVIVEFKGVEQDREAAEQYRTVIPICAGCKASGKEIIKRLKRK